MCCANLILRFAQEATCLECVCPSKYDTLPGINLEAPRLFLAPLVQIAQCFFLLTSKCEGVCFDFHICRTFGPPMLIWTPAPSTLPRCAFFPTRASLMRVTVQECAGCAFQQQLCLCVGLSDILLMRNFLMSCFFFSRCVWIL